MRVGIFGGSFDPVHNGHLALALACQDQASLDEVWFMPAAIQPLKRNGPHASDAERIEMLELAIAGEPTWRVCRLEIDRGGFSYTVDTLRQLRVELPEVELFLLLGADAVRDVAKWKEPAAIFRLATPLVVCRAGQPEPDLTELSTIGPAEHRPRLVSMSAMNISSTEIRGLASVGEATDALVPHEVAEYIRRRGLYR